MQREMARNNAQTIFRQQARNVRDQSNDGVSCQEKTKDSRDWK